MNLDKKQIFSSKKTEKMKKFTKYFFGV